MFTNYHVRANNKANPQMVTDRMKSWEAEHETCCYSISALLFHHLRLRSSQLWLWPKKLPNFNIFTKRQENQLTAEDLFATKTFVETPPVIQDTIAWSLIGLSEVWPKIPLGTALVAFFSSAQISRTSSSNCQKYISCVSKVKIPRGKFKFLSLSRYSWFLTTWLG